MKPVNFHPDIGPVCRTALALCLVAVQVPAVHAQSIPDEGGDAAADPSGKDRRYRGVRARGVRVVPYIEAAQVATAELSPGNEVLTYSRLAVGADVSVNGRRAGASASIRYERHFGWGKRAEDGDAISGIARGYATLAPGIQLEAGGLAARARIDGNGAAVLGGGVAAGPSAGKVLSAYAGPTVSRHLGTVQVEGGYRLGYARVDTSDAVAAPSGATRADLFDESVSHAASLRLSTRPGDPLPVGLGIGATANREDVSNFDQRVDDRSLRADATVPVGRDLAVVGGVGYENVKVSSRDALRDAAGNPVLGSNGRIRTDKSAPRRIAYQAEGLIWDAGVVWKPSRRTAFEAHVGKRYGSTTYYGSFAYAPSPRSAVNVSFYDSLSGFGGQLNRALAELPAEFEANRDVLSGDLTGCVGAVEGQPCLAGALGSLRSSAFRSRGVAASFNSQLGRIQGGIGAGFERRRFIAAPGTVLAAANGVVDENLWLSAYLNARVGARGTVSTNAYANLFRNGGASAGEVRAVGASAAYGHAITRQLSATAAFGLEGYLHESLPEDVWQASALVGVRYTF